MSTLLSTFLLSLSAITANLQIVNAAPGCYASTNKAVADCDSDSICKLIKHVDTAASCDVLQGVPGFYHSVFAPDPYACRMHVFTEGGCSKESKPKYMLTDDILLTEEQFQSIEAQKNKVVFTGAFDIYAAPWPQEGERYYVPYTIPKEDTWSDTELDALYWCMRWVEIGTVIRFVPRTNEDNYIALIEGTGCSSYLGMVGGKQNVNLAKSCRERHTIIHELFHALGMGHEHQRPDRDEHVNIFLENVEEGKEHNFEIRTGFSLVAPYDLGSIMHYDSWSFNKEGGVNTVEPKDVGLMPIMDSRSSSPTGCDFGTLNVKYLGYLGSHDCSPNHFYKVCKPTESCIDDGCQDLCDRQCDDNLGNKCSLLFETSLLTLMVEAVDNDMALPSDFPTEGPGPDPNVSSTTTKPTTSSTSSPTTTTPFRTRPTPSPTEPTEPTDPTEPTEKATTTTVKATAEKVTTATTVKATTEKVTTTTTKGDTTPATYGCYRNNPGTYWVSSCDDGNICNLHHEPVANSQDCTNLATSYPNPKWELSDYDCRVTTMKQGGCSSAPTEGPEWEAGPEGENACYISTISWANSCQDDGLCNFDGRYKTESDCSTAQGAHKIWAANEEECQKELLRVGSCMEM